jgi:ATP-dependent RNA helicase DDX55/SPB4
MLEGDEEVPVDPISSKTPKIIPQLLLGGNQTPAQDLAQFLSKSSNLLIGTPGRLLDILSSPHVHCPQSSFEVLVLDEADRLLDLGFKDDLQRILARLPKQRRTGLFSASVSDAVDQIIRVGLRNPIRVSVKVKSASGAVDKRTPASLQMSYLVIKPTQKLPAISQLLRRLNPVPQKSIIYVSTCAAVDYFQHILPVLLPSFAIVPLHGKHPPNVRQRNFSRFTESLNPTVLLTTDVAARGLDIPSVDLVVQIDPPSDPKVFLHRCGRAGRAGRRGLAVALLTPGREEDYIAFLAVRKTPVSQLVQPEIEITEQQAENATSCIRELVLTDRAIYDKAQRAFVSWVRAYSKHQASSIFRISDLDWTELGNAWGLLQLPKMPEVKGWSGDRSLGVSVDFSEFRYKDKAREKHRLEESTKAPVKKIQKEAGQAWSVKKDIKDIREARRAKRKTRRESEKVSKMTDQELVQKKELERMIIEVRGQAALDEGEWGGLSD